MFTEGKTVSKYPLRLAYIPISQTEAEGMPLKMGVSVSKKHFKKAVDRNYFKRLLREAYRHNKQVLLNGLDQPYAFILYYS